MIRKGDRVFIKAEYQDKGDSNLEWYAIEDQNDDGRIKIEARLRGWKVNPVYVMYLHMLEPSESNNAVFVHVRNDGRVFVDYGTCTGYESYEATLAVFMDDQRWDLLGKI